MNSERQSDLDAVMGIVFAEDTMVNRDPFTNLFQTIFKQPGCLAVVDNWWAVAGVGPAQEAEVAGNSKVRSINLGCNYNYGPLWQALAGSNSMLQCQRSRS